MNTLKLYRFSSPIQLTPLADNPNSTSEDGSLYYSSTDATIKVRQASTWEDVATISYVDAQEFGKNNILIVSNGIEGQKEVNDIVRWDGSKWKNVQPSALAPTTASAIIATNTSGVLDQSFIAYDLDRSGYKIYGLPIPEADSEAATKGYTDDEEFGRNNIDVAGKTPKDYLRWSGSLWQATPPLVLATGVSHDLIGTNASGYLDSSFLSYDLDRDGYAIYNLPTPDVDSAAATKGYVDNEELGRNNLNIIYDGIPGAKRVNDILRWNGSAWQNVMAVQTAAPYSSFTDEIISTNEDGFLDASFLEYNINRNGYTFYNLPTPTSSDQPATKGYVDGQPFGADNIEITDIQNRDLLQYDEPSSKWKNVRGLALENTGGITNVYVDATTLEQTVDNSITLVDNSTTTVNNSLTIDASGGGGGGGGDIPTLINVEKGAIDLSVGDVNVSGKLSLAIKDNEVKIGSTGGGGGGGVGDTYISITNNNTYETYAETNYNEYNEQNNYITKQVNEIQEIEYVTNTWNVDAKSYSTTVEEYYQVTSKEYKTEINITDNEIEFGSRTSGGGGGGDLDFSFKASNNKLSVKGGDVIINVASQSYTLNAPISITQVDQYTVEGDTYLTVASSSAVTKASNGSSEASVKVTPDSVRTHATSFAKAAGKNDPNQSNLYLIEKYDTDIILTENQSGSIGSMSFNLSDFAGARIEYRLKDAVNGDVRIGTFYVANNTGVASFTDHFAETNDMSVTLSAQIVNSKVEIQYENGAHNKSLHFDAKYFPN